MRGAARAAAATKLESRTEIRGLLNDSDPMTDPAVLDQLLREARQRGGHTSVSETIFQALTVYLAELRIAQDRSSGTRAQAPQGSIAPEIADDLGTEFSFPARKPGP